MSSENNYDEVLFPILCSEETIFGFFDRIFDFLYRKTDFFKLKGVDSDEFGLENGEAEKIVRSIFCKYMEAAAAERRNLQSCDIETVLLDCVAEETVVTTPVPDLKENAPPDLEENSTSQKKSLASKERLDDQQSNVPVMDSDSYNGASYEGYSWSQSIKDTDIRIKVPGKVSSGKQVRVDICQSRLKVEIREEVDSPWTLIQEGDLTWPINVEESTWTLVPHEHIHICLQKLQERWWDAFFVGEPKIDLKAIDPSIAYEELDPDSRAKIQELMHNEHMKRLGKPTHQQTKIENLLKEAWDKEGSPFKGQPFDPSIVDLQNQNS